MTRKDLKCVHEPFGDAYYFGPERLGYRYEGSENEQARQESGYANSTFRSIFDRIAKDNAEVRMSRSVLSALGTVHPLFASSSRRLTNCLFRSACAGRGRFQYHHPHAYPKTTITDLQ